MWSEKATGVKFTPKDIMFQNLGQLASSCEELQGLPASRDKAILHVIIQVISKLGLNKLIAPKKFH